MSGIRHASRSVPTMHGDGRRDVERREALAAARLREAGVEVRLDDVEALRVHAREEQAVGDLGAHAPGSSAPSSPCRWGCPCGRGGCSSAACRDPSRPGRGTGSGSAPRRTRAALSRAKMARTIVTYSRSQVSGLSNGTPCHPSTTCGPDVPRPRMKRPPDSGVERHRGHRRVRGRAPRELHDGRAEADLRRLRADPGERAHRVGAPRLGRPDRVEAEPLGLVDEVHVERDLRSRVADHQSESHRILLGSSPARGRRVLAVRPARTSRCASSARRQRERARDREVERALGVHREDRAHLLARRAAAAEDGRGRA